MKPDFREIEALTAYATTFRDVTPAGRIKDGPGPVQIARWISKIDAVIRRCETLFGIVWPGMGPGVS